MAHSKIHPEHYDHMKAAMSGLFHEADDRRAQIVVEGKAQDVEKRLRWDLSYAAGLTPWICDNIYPYANDDHIDTALRNIMKELAA